MYECEKPYAVFKTTTFQCVGNHRYNTYTHVYINVCKAIEFEWEELNEQQHES